MKRLAIIIRFMEGLFLIGRDKKTRNGGSNTYKNWRKTNASGSTGHHLTEDTGRDIISLYIMQL